VILLAILILASAYQVFAIAACVLFKKNQSRAKRQPDTVPAVSILKPVRGLDPAFREAIRSHTVLDGEYELLCGIRELNDPAASILREFPRVHVIDCHTQARNGKAGVLIDLAAAARNPVLVVNDSDISVQPDYLARVTAPLRDPGVGLVTCLYRPIGDTFAARFEGLGVSTDFAPSTLVARLVGVDEFAMGSTLAFRRVDLDRIGGFAAVADYLADDYQLGHRIHALGLKCVLSEVIVETHLGGGWRQVWKHQVRWARTIRVTKLSGYLGLPVTNATLWAIVAGAFGRWDWAVVLLALRVLMAIQAGWFVMRSRDMRRLWWLIPARDAFSFAVWLAGLAGNSVIWRGERLTLDRQGRIASIRP
jgi:ceramide glucosyltransferase